MGVDGHEVEANIGAGGRRSEGERSPGRERDDAKQGEVESWESGRKQRGGGAGTVERTMGPVAGEATSVIGVKMSQEIRLTSISPPVHRYQTTLHLSDLIVSPFGFLLSTTFLGS